MPNDFELDRRALEQLARSAMVERALVDAAESIRDTARSNAESISSDLAEAIEVGDPDRDAEGAYVDIGYDKTKPGFVLWWHEVGTRQYPAKPHLRPAVTQRGHLT